MSGPTLTDLQASDPAALRAAAVAWAALAAELDTAYERVRAGRGRIDEAGRGAAITAAAARLATKGRDLGASVLPARRIARVLLAHAEDMAALKNQLGALLSSAQANGLVVDGRTGAVTPAGAAPSEDRRQILAGTLRGELAELLARAQQLDAVTTTAIAAALPEHTQARRVARSAARDEATVLGRAARPPAEVLAWWQALPPQQREWTLQQHPQAVGGLDGIPAADRDRANRRYLEQLLAQPAPPPGLTAVRDRLATIDDAYLLLIDPRGDGRVAVALGNPDQARHTAVLVPGVSTDLHDIGGELARASQLQRTADRTTVGAGDVSVVYWLGYDPPDSLLDAWLEGPSRQGGAALTGFVEGLRATHAGPAGHLSAIGHSYGSTVVAEGALTGKLPVDDVVVVGSPGLHSDHARELNLDPRHVWVGRSATDEIRFAPEPIHGREPADPRYGANRFAASTSGHSGYWRPGSDSLLNQAYIVTGQYDRVTLVHGQAPA